MKTICVNGPYEYMKTCCCINGTATTLTYLRPERLQAGLWLFHKVAEDLEGVRRAALVRIDVIVS